MKYKVIYKRGYGSRIIEAKNPDDARKEAIAQYRFNSLMIDYLKPSEIIKSIEPIS